MLELIKSRLSKIFFVFIPIKSIWLYFPFRRKLQFILIVILFFFQAFAELLSIGSVLPFISAVSNPDYLYIVLQDYPYVLELLKITKPLDLIIPFFLIFLILIVTTLLFKLFTSYIALIIGANVGIELSNLLLRKVFSQNYLYFVKLDSNYLLRALVDKVSISTANFTSFVVLLNAFITIIVILTTFIILFPFFTLITSVFIITSYLIIIFLIKNKLDRNSKIQSVESVNVIKLIREAIGGVRNLILDNKQSFYIDTYIENKRVLDISIAMNNFLGLFPKNLMESIGIVFLSTFAVFYAIYTNNLIAVLPVLAIVAIAAQKLLPLFQQLYFSYAQIAGNYYINIEVSELLQLSESNMLEVQKDKLYFEKFVEFKNVNFSYNVEKPIIQNLNLKIPFGKKIGIVGDTGSGKTTFMDLFIGLLNPDKGEIFVDNNKLSQKNIYKWQNTLTHIPQNIFITNRSIYENVAFGEKNEDINFDKVRESIKIAQLENFVNNLPNKYETDLGERGIKISGGEKQRIGIARAIYKEFQVLTMDESTSSLDNVTELNLMKEIDCFGKNITIIIIAHRLTTIKNCDLILEFKDGSVINQGTFEELIKKSKTFKNLAKDLKE